MRDGVGTLSIGLSKLSGRTILSTVFSVWCQEASAHRAGTGKLQIRQPLRLWPIERRSWRFEGASTASYVSFSVYSDDRGCKQRKSPRLATGAAR